MRKGQLVTSAVLLFVLALFSFQNAHAVNGDNLRQIIADRTGTLCASVDADGNHASVGVGIAFDGANLLISCYGDSTVTAINPADGSQVAVHVISGANALGALAWDATNSQLWGCSDFGKVGIVDLTANTFTAMFDTYAVIFSDGSFGSGCFDGLAYDGTDDTIWASGDVSSSTEHYTTAGAAIAKFSNSGLIGFCGNSGIAVGGPVLYLANNGCSEIYTVQKDFSTSVLFAGFPRRLEDLECDPITFTAQNVGAIWSIDAYDNILNAWEIPADQCPLGGGGGEPLQGRMTGGGSVFTVDGGRVTHGFELHCDVTKGPNNLQVNWGRGNKFHLESLATAVCSDDPTITPNPPDAGFDTYVGAGIGRYNGQAGATAEWTFTDAGEPGKNDWATIVIKDASNTVVLSVSGNLNSGNHQAHRENNVAAADADRSESAALTPKSFLPLVSR